MTDEFTQRIIICNFLKIFHDFPDFCCCSRWQSGLFVVFRSDLLSAVAAKKRDLFCATLGGLILLDTLRTRQGEEVGMIQSLLERSERKRGPLPRLCDGGGEHLLARGRDLNTIAFIEFEIPAMAYEQSRDSCNTAVDEEEDVSEEMEVDALEDLRVAMKREVEEMATVQAHKRAKLWAKDGTNLTEAVETLHEYTEMYEHATAVRLHFENTKDIFGQQVRESVLRAAEDVVSDSLAGAGASSVQQINAFDYGCCAPDTPVLDPSAMSTAAPTVTADKRDADADIPAWR